MTYRERRKRKAERLREWADTRVTSATAVFKAGEPYRSDHAFITQPGHIPERARLIAREDRAHESLAKASIMTSRAAGIEAAADNAIYSDDPDAVERLEEKIAGLEAKRNRIKTINKAARAGKLGEIELTDGEKRDLLSIARHSYHDASKGYPSYALTNLGGNINRCRQRLERLRNPRPKLPRVITLRYGGNCEDCGRKLKRGDIATYDREERTTRCYPKCEAVTA
jgi:hypothetical protein